MRHEAKDKGKNIKLVKIFHYLVVKLEEGVKQETKINNRIETLKLLHSEKKTIINPEPYKIKMDVFNALYRSTLSFVNEICVINNNEPERKVQNIVVVKYLWRVEESQNEKYQSIR